MDVTQVISLLTELFILVKESFHHVSNMVYSGLWKILALKLKF